MMTKFCPLLINDWDGYLSGNIMVLSLMRLADVYLMYAEAVAMANDDIYAKVAGYDLTALEAVNKIRQRARKLLDPDNPNSQYISIPAANFQDVAYAPYDVTRDAILKEKRIEMAGEFDRWFEIARLGILSERMASVYKNAPVEQPSGKIRERGKYFR